MRLHLSLHKSSIYEHMFADHADETRAACRTTAPIARPFEWIFTRAKLDSVTQSRAVSSRLSTLPVELRGSSSMNTTSRGTL